MKQVFHFLVTAFRLLINKFRSKTKHRISVDVKDTDKNGTIDVVTIHIEEDDEHVEK